jgi:hypothetical protein
MEPRAAALLVPDSDARLGVTRHVGAADRPQGERRDRHETESDDDQEPSATDAVLLRLVRGMSLGGMMAS